jgi:hypothetical protein
LKIYVASSWRNLLQPAIVLALRKCGHEVYDFRNPAPGEARTVPGRGTGTGFQWAEIDPAWEKWTPKAYREALKHPRAREGYAADIGALRWCDACVLVLPSELGYALGQGKRCAVVMLEPIEPDLMYSEAEILTSMDELFEAFAPSGHELARR